MISERGKTRRPGVRPTPHAIEGGRAVDSDPEVPQDAAWLCEWQDRLGYLDQEAADVLAESVSNFRRQRNGIIPVSRQTARLALHVALHRTDWLELAERARKLALDIMPAKSRNGRRRRKQ